MELNTGSRLVNKNEHGMQGKGGVCKCLSFLKQVLVFSWKCATVSASVIRYTTTKIYDLAGVYSHDIFWGQFLPSFAALTC